MQVAGNLHADQRVEAGRIIAAYQRDLSLQSEAAAQQMADMGKFPEVETDDEAIELCNSLYFWCLDNGHYPWAARILWSPEIFNPEPRATKLIWDAIAESNALMLMGASSMSKSYSTGAWLYLDWTRDPEFTSVNVVGPSEDHLKDNLFTHLVTMHDQASLPQPGMTGDLFIGLDPRKRKSSIRGVVIPLGRKPSARLQGRKRIPRPHPHRIFGALSRIRFFVDEFEKVPIGIWKDIDNVFGNLTKDYDGMKIMGSFNPEDPVGSVAVRCEPPKGWTEFDPEKDEKWTSKRGWNVVRLDAARCENVIQNKEVFPGLQTKEGFDRIILNAGGTNTPAYWTMCRACFPRGDVMLSIFSELLVSKMRKVFLFAEEPVICGAADLALEGGDAAEFAVGRFGKAIGYRVGPTLDFPKGREVVFKTKEGQIKFRWALQLDKLITLPPADTLKMAMALKELAILMKVNPNWLMLDRTGNGAGIHDLLKAIWSSEVRGVGYSEAATERKIILEDTKTAKDEYERVVSELWFASKKWSEFGFYFIGPDAFSDELQQQLVGRRYQTGKLTRVESKPDYKLRGNSSPNKADAFTLLLHGVREASGIVPSAVDAVTPVPISGLPVQWDGPMPQLVDETNKQHYIEDADSDDYMT
jgi:hypothetical protein